MLLHGIAKLLSGVGFIEGMLTGIGLPAFIAYGVYIGEIVAPIMIMIGFRTRIAALVLAFNMIVAIGLVHMGELFSVGQNGGYALELQAFYLLNAIALFFTGAGRLAVSKSNSWD
jgi:putative oxidoreductase